jgi:hypothetical protein
MWAMSYPLTLTNSVSGWIIMLDKLFKKVNKNKDEAKEQPKAENKQSSQEDMLDETGTFMLDINQLKETEDLEDLLNDV